MTSVTEEMIEAAATAKWGNAEVQEWLRGITVPPRSFLRPAIEAALSASPAAQTEPVGILGAQDLASAAASLLEVFADQFKASDDTASWSMASVMAGKIRALSRIAAERDEAKERAINNWRNMQRLWDLAQGWDPDDNEEGPRCRDCADEDGRCPHSGYPCDPQEEAEERIGKLFARASAAERERDELKAALKRIAEHPDRKELERDKYGELTGSSFGPGWAFFNVRNIARAALRTPEESP